jgi:hypothetical protein
MSSENAHDAGALAECFAADATVRDEGRTRAGLTEIAAWRRETTDKYHHTVEPVAVAERDGKIIVATKVSGDFPGSRSRSTLPSGSRRARFHRWRFSRKAEQKTRRDCSRRVATFVSRWSRR